MPVTWDSSGGRASVDIRPGEAGNNWVILDRNGAIDGGPTGGGRDRDELWGRGDRGGLLYRGPLFKSNPKQFKVKWTYPLTSENFLKKLGNCPFTLRARQYCDPNRTNMTGFVSPGMIGYHTVTSTTDGFDNSPAMEDGQAKQVKMTQDGQAGLKQHYAPLTHLDVSNGTNDVQNNKVIQIGADACAGACGFPDASEEDSWAWVTAKDTTPLYSGSSVPWFYYTVDRFATRNGVRIDPFTGVDATDVILMGSKFVVFSPNKAPAYAAFADIVNGVTAPNLWFTCSGFSAISSPNFPTAAVSINSSVALAVGAGGRIWQSTDGGITWTLIDNAGISTVNYSCITAQNDGNAFIGGATGTLVRMLKIPGQTTYTGSVVVVKDAAGNLLASNINCVETPPGRGDEVDIGTAGGEVWRSRNMLATKPVFVNMPVDRKGTGQIIDIEFSGYHGDVMWVLQNDANGNSRVIRDLSGSALGPDQDISFNDFVTPGNNGYKSIASCNPNCCVVVGAVHSAFGYIGQIINAG